MPETLEVVLADGHLGIAGRWSGTQQISGLVAVVAGSEPERSFVTAQEPSGTFSFDLDVDLLHRSLGAPTGAYDFFVELTSDGRRRLGGFSETDRDRAVDPVPVGDTAAWVHVTEHGNVSLLLADEPRRKVTATTTHLVTGPTGIALEMELQTFSRPVDSAVGSWTRRATGERHEVALQVVDRPDHRRRGRGLFHQALRGTIPPPATDDEESGGDAVHDPFVEVHLRGVTEPVRVPIRPGGGRTALREIVLDRGDTRQVLIPHLTFRGRRLAFWSETFSAADHAFVQRLRWVSWMFAPVRPFLRIWLVGETPYKAQDNGFAFFAWLRREHPNRRAFYVIEADSPDRGRVEPLGNVLLRHSRRHVLLTLLASRFVGSHHAEYLYASRSRSVVRRVGGIRVFLQHGVTAMKNVTLNYGLRRMVESPPDVFCVNAPAEREIVVRELEYRPSQVPITGFTRFDTLLAPGGAPEPRLLVMPTWRDWLGDRDSFADSDFVRQWTAFLDAVVPVAAAHDLGVDLVLHPNMRHHRALFERPGVTVRGPGDDVQTLLRSTTLLVTDYSSVGWDFSFLDRPVVYLQFDLARFTGGRPPFIDYATQLPGDTATTVLAAIDLVDRALAGGARLRPELRERARAFLQHADTEACRRTYDVVRRADGPGPRLLRVRTALLRRDADRRTRRAAGRARRLVGRVVRGLARRVRPAAPDRAPGVATLLPRIAAVPRRPVGEWDALRRDVLAVAPGGDGLAGLGLHDRVAVWLVQHDRRDDLVTALVDVDRHGRSFRSVRDDPDGLARPGYLEALSAPVPHEVLRPTAADLTLGLDLDQTPGRRLHLRGSAFVRGMRFDAQADTVRLWVHDRGSRTPVTVVPAPDPIVDTVSGDRWCSYADAGFRAVLDPHPGPGARLEVQVTSGEVTRSRTVDLVPPADPGGPTLVSVQPGPQGIDLGIDLGLVGADDAVLTATGRLRGLDVDPRPGGVHLRLVTDDGLAVDSGRYLLSSDDAGGAVNIADDLAARLPIEGTADLVAWRLAVREGRLELTTRSPLPVAERGRLHQRLLIDEVHARAGDLQDAILALCFSGRGAGDSVEPLVAELARRLGWPVRWGVTDHAVAVPDGVEPVLLHSRAWHEAVVSSRLLVNNAHFPAYMEKRPGQLYVQTWHGSPLKRIGLDVPPEALSLSYRALMDREAASWDLLLAQSEVAADLLAPAFGYTGEVLATGYPRNDALVAPDAADHRRRVRTELGLADHHRAVLYAPTWRDQVTTASNQAALVTHLDPVRLRALLGDDVVVLLRGHSNTARGRSAATDVVDVTDHPDLPGLYLAADVLVTDYSSVMFDAVVTGCPVVLLAPDLEEYRDSTRGFYLDLAEIAPGPIVRSTDEVAEQVADLDALVERHAERYASFVRRFAPHDDGGAAARVADRVEELLRGGPAGA